MEIAGYLASLLIGVTLGLMGGGGSILTVPVLVYLFGVEPVLATAYSLFVVGVSSFMGAIPRLKQGLAHVKTAVVFGIPSLTAVFLTRKFLVPAIPDELFEVNGFLVTRSVFLMLFFSLLMILASFSMIRDAKKREETVSEKLNYPLILLLGLLEGSVTGLVGAGGGFLIIPALVLLTGLPMQQAVGTSLLIVSVKSLIGFSADITLYPIEWDFLIKIALLSIVGIIIGSKTSERFDGPQLKRSFGWFVLVMGILVLVKELFLGQ